MISIFYGGGTIQSAVSKEGVRTAGSADLVALLKQHAPEAGKMLDEAGFHEPVTVYEGLSENVDSVLMKLICERIKESIVAKASNRAIISFGTDCMIHFAQYLSVFFAEAILKDQLRIVVTGANKDVSQPDSDAWNNLSLAIQNSDGNAGLYIAFGGKIISAQSAAICPFNGTAMEIADVNAEDYKELLANLDRKREPLVEQFRVPIETGLERKALLYPVNRPEIINHTSILQAAEALDAQIIIFVLYHSGTANVVSSSASVAELVAELRSVHKITCFGATENGEPISLNAYDTSVKLRKAGLVPLYNMDYMVAFEKAKYMLQLGVAPEKYIEAMYTDCYGEIDTTLINKEYTDELVALYCQSVDGQE